MSKFAGTAKIAACNVAVSLWYQSDLWRILGINLHLLHVRDSLTLTSGFQILGQCETRSDPTLFERGLLRLTLWRSLTLEKVSLGHQRQRI
jgi:hypothetical protein